MNKIILLVAFAAFLGALPALATKNEDETVGQHQRGLANTLGLKKQSSGGGLLSKLTSFGRNTTSGYQSHELKRHEEDKDVERKKVKDRKHKSKKHYDEFYQTHDDEYKRKDNKHKKSKKHHHDDDDDDDRRRTKEEKKHKNKHHHKSRKHHDDD